MKKITYIFPVVFFAFLFFLNNIFMPFVCDDYGFRVSPEPLSFYDNILYSAEQAYIRYFSWGGQFFWWFYQYILLNIDKFYFDIINTAFFMALILILFLMTQYKKNRNMLLTYTCIIFALCNIAAPAENTLWKVGTTDYLHPLVLSCVWVYLFLLILNEQKQNCKTSVLLLCVLGLIIGNSHGVIGGLTFLVCLLYFLRSRIVFCKKHFFITLPLFCVLAGICLYVLSPGNARRFQAYIQMGNDTGCILFIKNFIVFLRDNIILFSVDCLIVIYTFLHHKGKYRSLFRPDMIFSFSTICAAVLLCMVPSSPRSFLFFPIYSCVAFACFLKRINIETIIPKRIFIFFAVLVSIVYCTKMTFSIYRTFDVYCFFKARDSQIQKQKKSGQLDVVVESATQCNLKQTSYMKLFTLDDLSSPPDFWINKSAARYYQVKSITTPAQQARDLKTGEMK